MPAIARPLFLYLILSQTSGEVGWLSYFDEEIGGQEYRELALYCPAFVCGYMYVCTNAFMCVWRLEVSIESHPLLFSTLFLRFSRRPQLTFLSRLTVQKVPGIFLSLFS